MKKNKKLLKNLKKSLDIVESEIRLDENGESIDLNGGSSLILECELGCEEISNLKSGIDSISSVLGNSVDCFVSPQGFSICPETIYEKLHNLSSDKIGENNELAGTETLFQLNYLIKDSLTSNFSQFGEETILGKVDKIEKNKLGNCGDQSICEILQENTGDLDLTKSCLNTIKTNINSLQNSVNGTQASINGVQFTVNTLPTLTSIEDSLVLAKQATLNSVGSVVNDIHSTVNSLPTLASIENSTILAKEATLNSVGSAVNAIQSSVNGIQSTVNTLPTLATIEGSAVLAKQAALNSIQSSVNNVQSTVNGIQGTVNTLPTLATIEGSAVLAKQAGLNAIKAETDLIGLPTDTSSTQTLFGKIADLKDDISGIHCGGGGGTFDPLDPCFLKVMARFAIYARTGEYLVFNNDGSLVGANTPTSSFNAFNLLGNPSNWTSICTGL